MLSTLMLGWVASKIVDACLPNNMKMKLLLSGLKPPELSVKGLAPLLLDSAASKPFGSGIARSGSGCWLWVPHLL